MLSKLKRMLWGAVLLAGCRGSLGTDFQGGVFVQASVGGTFAISPADDPMLAGTSISIPPDALTEDTTITVATSTSSVALAGTTAAGPVVVVGPAGTTLRGPVSITLPFTLPPSTSEVQLFVGENDGLGDHGIFQEPSIAVDPTAGAVGFVTTTFGAFGAVVGPLCSFSRPCADSSSVCLSDVCTGDLGDAGLRLACGVDGDCLVGETCDAGVCVGDGG